MDMQTVTTLTPNMSGTLSSLLGEVQLALEQDPHGASQRLTQAITILSRMSEPHASKPAPPAGGLTPWRIRNIDNYIAANMDQQISASELAACAGLSPGHFARAFKISLGMPPHRYLMRERIARAKLLMLTSSSSLSEIALACGLADQSHFSRLFHRLEGETPTAWRRRLIGR